MPLPVLIALLIGAWAVIAIAVAVILGSTASAAEHEREMGALHREVRRADAAADRSTGGPAAEGPISGISTLPRS